MGVVFAALSLRQCSVILKAMGRPACELFDLMVGTSTGILALGLSRPDSEASARFNAQQVVELYEHHGAQIFEYSLWRKFRTAGDSRGGVFPRKSGKDFGGLFFSRAAG